MKKTLLALVLVPSMYGMFSRPMCFVVGTVVGACSVPYVVQVKPLDQEFKNSQERIDHGNKQIRTLAKSWREQAYNSLQDVIKNSTHTQEEKKEKEDSEE